MIQLLLLLVFLACIGVGAAWIAENPGTIVFYTGDYRVDTSIAVIATIAVLTCLALVIIYAVLASIFQWPGAWMQRRTLKHYRAGLTELTWGVASLAASDIASAQSHTQKAEKWLGKTPITLLLSAQIARSKGEENTTHALLEQMLEFKETEYLSARLLSESASKHQLLPKALLLAERAQQASPHEQVATLSVVSLHIRLGQFQDALRALERNARKVRLPRSQLNRLRGIIFYGQTQTQLEEHNESATLGSAKKMLRYLPDFPPAIVLAAECHYRHKATDKALNLLQRGWENTGHPAIAARLRHLSVGTDPKKRERLLAKLGAVEEHVVAWRCSSCGESCSAWNPHCPACDSLDTLRSTL